MLLTKPVLLVSLSTRPNCLYLKYDIDSDVLSPVEEKCHPRVRFYGLWTINYGFSECGLEKVVGLTAEENFGSVRILEKLGFKFEEKFLFNNTKAFKYHYTRGFDR